MCNVNVFLKEIILSFSLTKKKQKVKAKTTILSFALKQKKQKFKTS